MPGSGVASGVVPGVEAERTSLAPRFDVEGRVALVTGAAQGIGASIAVAMAQAGADVVLGLRDAARGSSTLAAVEATGRHGLEVQMDVSDVAEVRAAAEAAVAHFGRIDILVNNAGVGPENPAEDVTEADFELTCAVNLRGTFFASQLVGRRMLEQGFGRIVNVSSQAGFVALPGESVYCMTKAAIVHLTRCLAIEWGPRGVNVNAVAPTFIETPGTSAALADDQFRQDVQQRIAALHRIGTPTDVVGAVLFLVSPAAAMITGETILIDGGWTAR